VWLADPDAAGGVRHKEGEPAGVGLHPGVAALSAVLLNSQTFMRDSKSFSTFDLPSYSYQWLEQKECYEPCNAASTYPPNTSETPGSRVVDPDSLSLYEQISCQNFSENF